MALTVAQIAARAFTAVAAKITDAIHTATLTRTVDGVYSATAGAYATTSVVQTGRAVVDTVRPVSDVFPSFVVGAGDQLVLLEGFTSAMENDVLAFAGKTLTVRAVQDIVAASSLFYCVAR